MLCTSTAGFGFFQDKEKEVCFAFVALAGGHDGMRQEEAPILYFLAFSHFARSLQIHYSNL